MQQSLPPLMQDPALSALIKKRMTLENQLKSGASWFFIIAALSLVNSIIYLTNGGITFIVGLGVTQLVDGVVSGLASRVTSSADLLRIAGIGVNVLVAAIFVLYGILGRKRQRLFFIIGIVAYVLDTIVFIVFKEYSAVAFHLLALWGLFGGLRAMNSLAKLDQPAPAALSPYPQIGAITEESHFSGASILTILGIIGTVLLVVLAVALLLLFLA